MLPLERTEVFIGCCVDHAASYGERRPVPLLSHYLHVIPVSMILKCACATKTTDFSYTVRLLWSNSRIALKQCQSCSGARILSFKKLESVLGGNSNGKAPGNSLVRFTKPRGASGPRLFVCKTSDLSSFLQPPPVYTLQINTAELTMTKRKANTDAVQAIGE